MNPLLFVFNPRHIPACVGSIERLPVDQCWLTGFRENALESLINDTVQSTSYSHYLCCSDDGVIPPFALDAVLAALDSCDAATGYSNLDHTDMRVNLTKSPFLVDHESRADDYDLYHLSEVLGHPGELVRTWFAGFALTGMTRDLWLEFPFRATGAPSDWSLSRRLQDADVEMYAHQAAFMWHDKEKVNQPPTDPSRQLLIGRVEPTVTMRQRERVAA